MRQNFRQGTNEEILEVVLEFIKEFTGDEDDS